MRLSLFETAIWAAGPVSECRVAHRAVHSPTPSSVLCRSPSGQHSASFPLRCFTRLRHLGPRTYAHLYWCAEAIDALLQIAVVAQVAQIVFRPLRDGIHAKRIHLLLFAAAIAVAAFLLTLSVHPPASTLAGILEIRGQLFTSILICAVFTIVLFFSQKFGLYWRSHVMSVGYGLTAWAVVSVALDLLHSYLGREGHFLAVEHVRMLVYLSILVYWIVALWRNEPEKENVLLKNCEMLSCI